MSIINTMRCLFAGLFQLQQIIMCAFCNYQLFLELFICEDMCCTFIVFIGHSHNGTHCNETTLFLSMQTSMGTIFTFNVFCFIAGTAHVVVH